jgi:hypothetical protein
MGPAACRQTKRPVNNSASADVELRRLQCIFCRSFSMNSRSSSRSSPTIFLRSFGFCTRTWRTSEFPCPWHQSHGWPVVIDLAQGPGPFSQCVPAEHRHGVEFGQPEQDEDQSHETCGTVGVSAETSPTRKGRPSARGGSFAISAGRATIATSSDEPAPLMDIEFDQAFLSHFQ